MRRRLGIGAMGLLWVLLGTTGAAGATQLPNDFYLYNVFFDNDSNAATGCEVAAHDANFAGPVQGVEYVLTASVERFPSGALIDRVWVRKCISGSDFTSLEDIDAGNWDVGLEVGAGGADVVEFYVPRAKVGNPTSSTLGFHATRAASIVNDVLLTTDGSNDGETIVLRLAADQAVPTLSTFALLICIGFLAAVAARGLRRHRAASRVAILGSLVVSLAATVWAVTIVLDGNINDWASTPVLATDITGDSSASDPAEDIVVAFATFDAQRIYFRMDLVNLAPTECGNGVLEPGEFCEQVADCFIEFESLGDRGGAASGACMCSSCQCTGDCTDP